MARRFDNRWRSFVIFLSVIGLVPQSILADNDNDGHGGIPGEARPTELGAPWPMKKPTLSTVQASVSMNTTEYDVENGGPYPERIIGGDVTRPGAWPWIAAIYNGGVLCGGTLITNRHILSATHCVPHARPSDVKVRLGDYNIFTNNEVRHIERRVINIVRAPGYDARQLFNDITILTMHAPVQFTRAVQPIDLPSRAQIYDGRMGTIIGWGCTRIKGTPTSTLRQSSVPISRNAECRAVDSKMCVVHPGKSTCPGDSGGPLMVNEGGKWIQVGITSSGLVTSDGRMISYFTRVSNYMAWIHQNLR